MADDIRLDLLMKEVKDEYVQENFRKLKRYLDCIERKIEDGGGGDTTNIINNINNSPWSAIDTESIPASTMEVLDSKVLASTDCGEYKVCIKEQGGSKSKNFNVKYRKTDTDVVDQIYGKSGDIMDVSTSVVRTLTDIELQVTNNELYAVDVSLTEINT